MVKRKSEELLQQADKIAEDQEVIKPTDSEKSCIASFCTVSLKCKKLEAEAREKVKDAKPKVKELRERLLESMKADSVEILQVPNDLRKRASAASLASGGEAFPAYIRVTKNSKDVTITPEVVEEAFNGLTEEDILESQEDGTDALISAVLVSVRRLIRSFNEQAKLTHSLPRGVKAVDVEIADASLAEDALKLHSTSEEVLKVEREKREAIAKLKQDIQAKSADVEKFFTRANMTSQRVNLDNEAYNLCCRTTVTRPKVTLKLLENFLQDGVKDCLTAGSKRKPTKSDVLASFKTKKDELLRILSAKLNTLTSSSKKIVHLQRVAKK